MSVEENRVRVRRLYEDVFNKRHLAAIDDFFAPTIIDHALPPGVPGGIEGVKQTIAMFLKAFPDLIPRLRRSSWKETRSLPV